MCLSKKQHTSKHFPRCPHKCFINIQALLIMEGHPHASPNQINCVKTTDPY